MDNSIVITRHVKAPRERVFDAFTDPSHISMWWGPRGFTTSTLEHDLRVGGRWRFIMHGPDGTDWDNRMEYTEVVPSSRLAYYHGTDVDNDAMRWNVVITFDDVDDGTLITMRSFAVSAEQYKTWTEIGAVEGGKETLARLDEYFASEASVYVHERTFDAPRDLVWATFTQEEHMKHWWGPKGMPLVKCALDLRPGGTFHYGMQTPDRSVMWDMLRYREIVAPQRLVYVVEFSDENGGLHRHPLSNEWPLHVLSVATFSESDGKTTITIHSMPINASADETAVYASAHGGMNVGMKGMYDTYEEYLSTLQ